MNLIDTARALAERAHKGQFRKNGTTPYIAHPLAVAQRLIGESDEVIAVALLHDSMENDAAHPISPFALTSSGLPVEVQSAILAMTHREGENYEYYLGQLKHNPIARKVKVADMLSNLADSPSKNQIIKYARGLLFLMED